MVTACLENSIKKTVGQLQLTQKAAGITDELSLHSSNDEYKNILVCLTLLLIVEGHHSESHVFYLMHFHLYSCNHVNLGFIPVY